jgi:hypothetical protein
MRRELVQPSARSHGRGGPAADPDLCALHTASDMATFTRAARSGGSVHLAVVRAAVQWRAVMLPVCNHYHCQRPASSSLPLAAATSAPAATASCSARIRGRRAHPARAAAVCSRGAGRRRCGGCGQVLVPGAVSDRDRRQRPSRLITATARIRRAALARAEGAWPRCGSERARKRDAWEAGAPELSRRSLQRGLLVAPRVDNLPAGCWRSTCVRGGERAIVRNLAPLQPYNAQTCVSSLGLHALAQHREAWMGIS